MATVSNSASLVTGNNSLASNFKYSADGKFRSTNKIDEFLRMGFFFFSQILMSINKHNNNKIWSKKKFVSSFKLLRKRIFFSFLQIAEQQALITEKIDTNELKKEYSADDKIYQDKVSVRIEKKLNFFSSILNHLGID